MVRADMRHIHIIGIGAGNPDHLTMEAVSAIAASDVFFLFDKGEDKSQLTDLRRYLIERHKAGAPYRLVWGESPQWASRESGYGAVVDDLNARKRLLTAELIDSEVRPGQSGAILVWGDPTLYDSTLRIMRAVCQGRDDVDYSVIPGIGSLQALAARHRIPLNAIGGAVTITPGRGLAALMSQRPETVAVMLDSRDAFQEACGAGYVIHYGAYVGLPQEKLFEGSLDTLAETIAAYRRDARARHGWIMDSYILSRPLTA